MIYTFKKDYLGEYKRDALYAYFPRILCGKLYWFETIEVYYSNYYYSSGSKWKPETVFVFPKKRQMTESEMKYLNAMRKIYPYRKTKRFWERFQK